MRLLAALACWALLASLAHAQIFTTGCSTLTPPGPVRNLNIVINKFGDGGRINFKAPKSRPEVCVDYYEVKMVENTPTPKAVANVPSQTKETSVQVKGLKPGTEYLVEVTPVNAKGRGETVAQTVIPVQSTPCDRNPPPVKDLTAQYIDARTMTVQWLPGDKCYGGADVEVVDASNKRVFFSSVKDVAVKVPGLKPRTAYKVTVTPYSDNSNKKGPPTSITTTSPCDATMTPGTVVGLAARATAPAGTILVDVKGTNNDACVAVWELNARSGGQNIGSKVNVTDPSNPAVLGMKLNGRPNQRYTIQVTAVGPSGKRGVTGQIGPILADAKTTQETAPVAVQRTTP